MYVEVRPGLTTYLLTIVPVCLFACLWHLICLINTKWLSWLFLMTLHTCLMTQQKFRMSLMIVHLMAPQVLKYQAHRPFVKDLEALVKWTSEFQNPLIHIQIYSSTIFFLYVKHFWIFGYLSNWEMTGLSLTLVYSSTNMSKSVWTSGFWKPHVQKNMSNFWNNIFHKFSILKSNFGRQENEKCSVVLAIC